MKCIICSFLLLSFINSAWALVTWPNYIDNANCLTNTGYPECGQAQMPNINQYTDAGSYTDIAKIMRLEGFLIRDKSGNPIHKKFKIKFTGKVKNYNAGPASGNIPLKSKSGDVVYKLFGLNGSSFDVFFEGCWVQGQDHAGMESQCQIDMPGRHYIGSISIDDLLNKGEVVLEKEFAANGKYPFRLNKMDVTFARKPYQGGFPKPWLRAYNSDSTTKAQVRVLEFPGFQLQWDLIDMRNFEHSVRTDHFWMIAPKSVRLNDRKCELITNPKIEFGKWNLPSSHTGKVGEERHATIGLRCNGYFDGQNPNGDGVVHNSGAYVSHTITGVDLSASNLIDGLDGQKKIGLSHSDGSVAQNLYVEGSFDEGQQCSSSPIAIGVTRVDGWAKVGSNKNPNTSITQDPYTHIYWKLCKKEGTVPAGSYTGNATLKLRYK